MFAVELSEKYGRLRMGKEATQFKEGNKGKPKGAVNKLTRTVKSTVLAVFNNLQEDPKHSLEAFAKKYPRDFYQIAAKLIPTEIKGDFNVNKPIIIDWTGNYKDNSDTEAT